MAIKAGVDGCGQWPTDLSAGPENRNYHNFGCASQNNLAEMIANPSDLLGPRGSTAIDAERRLKVIDAYRKAENQTTVYDAE
jgi:pilus assembly protein CpaD